MLRPIEPVSFRRSFQENMSVQQSRWRSTLDIVTTVVTLATCIFVVALIAQQRFGRPAPASPKLAAGAVLEPTAEIGFGSSDVTILVGISSTCRFCDESMPAFRQLNKYVQSRSSMRVLAVALEPIETLRTYLARSGLTAFQPFTIDRGAPVSVVAAVTPQVVAVNRDGTVLEAWAGKITEDQLNNFVGRLIGATPPR